MLRIFSKIALSIGAILGIHFLEINKEKPTLITRPPEAKLSRATTVKSIDDIELFEKMNKCSFEFTKNFEKKEFYKAKEFLEKIEANKRVAWKNNIIKTINSEKIDCVKTKKVVFSLDDKKKYKLREIKPNEWK